MKTNKKIEDVYLPIAYKKPEEASRLAAFLLEKGFKGEPNPISPIDVIVVRVGQKSFDASDSITCIACWCGGKRKPLYVEEFIDDYERIVVQGDVDFYEQLVRLNNLDEKRPGGGILSADEAKRIKGDKRLQELIEMVEESQEKRRKEEFKTPQA